MRTLKTFVIAAALLAAPAAALAQGTPAQDVTPAGTTAQGSPVEGSVSASRVLEPAPVGAEAAPAPAFDHVAPTPGVGMPTPGAFAIQPQVTEIGQRALWLHDAVLMPTIVAITLLVLALLLWVVVRYRRSANPTPSRTSHNTLIEVLWTILPVIALVIIAVPSIKLLAAQYAPPKADLTVKVIGNQWYWTYQYPDNGDFELVSNMLKESNEVAPGARARTDVDGPRLLAVDERMVVPAGAVVKLIVTSADVIHSFAVPAFWTKMDAVPGKLNETWFKVDRPGVYFGQCSELCGPRHAFMPIAVEVVTPARFAAWVASKGGTMPGAAPANPDATATSPITAPGAAPVANSAPGADTEAVEQTAPPANLVPGTATTAPTPARNSPSAHQ